MTSPLLLGLEFWHSGTLCSYEAPSPPHLLSEAGLCSLCLFFPLKEYLLFLCSSYAAVFVWSVENDTPSHDEWYLTPGFFSGGAHTLLWICMSLESSCTYLQYSHCKTCLYSHFNTKVLQMKIKCLLINLRDKLDNLLVWGSCFLVGSL